VRRDAVTTPEQRASEVLGTITRLLATDNYEWARETLEGIYRTVFYAGKASIAQEEAVTHIIIGRLKHDHS
jgi:hypothetical protein